MAVVQWNCRGYYGNFEDLKTLLMHLNGPACICLQETFHGNKIPYPPKGYTALSAPAVVAYAPHVRPSRGVLTLVKTTIPYYQINLNTTLEAIAIRFNIGKEYTICNVYITPTEVVTKLDLQNLINQLPQPYLLIGDFNARNNLWGDSQENSHGRIVEDFLLDSDVCLLNTGAPTHFHVQTATESCIDLAFASPDALTDFNWKPLDDNYNSDHYPILLAKILTTLLARTPHLI